MATKHYKCETFSGLKIAGTGIKFEKGEVALDDKNKIKVLEKYIKENPAMKISSFIPRVPLSEEEAVTEDDFEDEDDDEDGAK
ncbi:hypothetical protein LCGC14_2913380 [marine sediment metagenome]|uniref:Uncharacterized protein n=1 Tax=marine sediment metagenome TaxID=412755 RepID=A0A0F8XR09_9ZZZZ